MNAANHFHQPADLEKASPALSDRALLGLPEHFTATRELSLDESQLRKLAGASPQALVNILESQDEPLEMRYHAGAFLALIGDPRLNACAPDMVDIPATVASIGLDSGRLDQVMEDLADLKLDRLWIAKEIPTHTVRLNAFRIARYPVTNHEYRTFLLESGQRRIPENWFLGRYPLEQANHPVSGIRAQDADAYAAWLSDKTGRGFRLPTEAEWEYACAGAERHEYPWGNRFLPDHANTAESGILATTPVGMFACGASPFGCHDMAGNVEEFVADDYAAYPGGDSVVDDLVEKVGQHRVARGGSYSRFRDLARASRRHGKFPRDIYVMGFRLAETL